MDSGIFTFVFVIFVMMIVLIGIRRKPRLIQLVISISFGSSLLIGCSLGSSASPNAPVNVIATAGDHVVNLTWQPPAANGASVTKYEIVSNLSQFGENKVVATVGSGKISYQVTDLHNCEPTRWTIRAVSVHGSESTDANLSNTTWTHGVPHNPPESVVILADGVGSTIPISAYAPLSDVSTYCSFTGEDTNFPQPLAALVDLFHGDPVTSPTYGTRLTDTLAGEDAILLPFSYTGTKMIKTGNGTVEFAFGPYSASDVADTDPQEAANRMDNEIRSVHNVWPNARIYLIGHSNGGLVAGFWWFYHGRYDRQGVKHVWSLDAPVNGVGNDGSCNVVGCPFGVGAKLANTYTALWQHQVELDPRFLASDTDGTFTPIGTQGDPLYDLGNTPVDGLISQLYFNEPTCANSGFNMKVCQPQGPSVISKCPVQRNSNLGLSGHVLVENCPGVIDLISNVISPPTATPTSDNLTHVNWANFTYTFSGDRAGDSIKATNGKANNGGFNWFFVLPPTYGDLTGDGKVEAAVIFQVCNADCGHPELVVYTGTASHPIPMNGPSLDFDSPQGHGDFGPDTVTIHDETLILTGRGYSPSTGACCPDFSVSASYRWNGTSFARVNLTTSPIPTPTP